MWVVIAIMIIMEVSMRPVQMTLDEALIDEVDRAAAKLGTTRSAFTREALRQALARVRTRELERRHREGYRRKPARKDEFAAWEREQAWGEP
jgi:CopG family transcriptional regulator / antitoxin EndoAI